MNVIGIICRMLGVKGSCWKQDTLADIGVGGVSLILEGRLGIVLDGSLERQWEWIGSTIRPCRRVATYV